MWGGGEGLSDLAKTMASAVHIEQEYKVEKLRYKKFEVTHQIQIPPSNAWTNSPGSVQMKFYSRDWSIEYHLLVNNNNVERRGAYYL